MDFLGRLFYLFISRACSSISRQASWTTVISQHNVCLFLLFWKETTCCLCASLVFMCLFHCILSEEVTIWGMVHALCIIHKGVSYVLMVQMIVSVNLNKSAYLKYFLDIFFMLTAHRWTLSFLWLFCSSNTVHTVFLLRPQLYISTFLFFFFFFKDHIVAHSMVYSWFFCLLVLVCGNF